MSYDRLNIDEIRGTTQADYLVSLDAHFCMVNGSESIFDEPFFPVVELARSLLLWLCHPDEEDFEFDSMSYEQIGLFAIRRHDSEWSFELNLGPGSSTPPVSWAEMDRICRHFVARVESDLLELGIDPHKVIYC